ncbi:alpha/beta fold hydrolase [Streptomyces sp. Z26]|uniref:alpha/beta fold hydrolase n=1 Tax=Streptomyces sp. Z26 TaxID=2500177 RepID=UPI000EF168EB|nr:alpha/beta fold hydrolase [Streptomyces sp. Z26]RLL70453.1 alpha/beta fold hydrolase [Streptomyces sp. Z26]
MIRKAKAAALTALCCTVAGTGLLAGTGATLAHANSSTPAATSQAASSTTAPAASFTGTKKIDVDGRAVNVSCSGRPERGEPVVMLLHGGGDSLEKMAGLQKRLAAKDRVCSYDRLGAGASDQPPGPQTLADSSEVLTAVLDHVAGDSPVVLAGHSLGGLLAARYAPDHRDRVDGVVLMDATSPTQSADVVREIPESATGPAAEMRDQFLAIAGGENPERLTLPDGDVRCAGDIPVAILRHGQRYLAEVPEYGPGLERAWTAGQHKWRALSPDSHVTAVRDSGHYIYLDAPALTAKTIHHVTKTA